MQRTDLLTLEQRTLLRNLGGWMIADALLDPAHGCAALHTSMWGGTYRHGDHHAFFECTNRGIAVYAYSAPPGRDLAPEDFADAAAFEQALGRHELLLVRWTQLARYAATIPTPARDELHRARKQLQIAWLAVCGPSPAPGRRPPKRDPAQDQQRHTAHRAAGEHLNHALAAALPLTEAAQQLDLFKLLPA